MSQTHLASLVKRFADSECSWLSTVRRDGRLHAAPVWHVWYQGNAYVVTTAHAVKTENLKHNPSVVITHPEPIQALILEGSAAFVDDMDDALRPLFQAKYEWDFVTDEKYSVVIQIRPTRLIAWGEEGAGHRQRWTGSEVSAAL